MFASQFSCHAFIGLFVYESPHFNPLLTCSASCNTVLFLWLWLIPMLSSAWIFMCLRNRTCIFGCVKASLWKKCGEFMVYLLCPYSHVLLLYHLPVVVNGKGFQLSFFIYLPFFFYTSVLNIRILSMYRIVVQCLTTQQTALVWLYLVCVLSFVFCLFWGQQPSEQTSRFTESTLLVLLS